MNNSNKDIVLSFLDASVRGDKEAMKDLLHPDVQVIEAESLPYGGVSKGPDEFIELIRRVFTTWENTEVSVHQVLADGDHVVLLAEMTGRGRATSKDFSVPIAEVWRLENAKIREVRPFYFDTKLLHDVYLGTDDS